MLAAGAVDYSGVKVAFQGLRTAGRAITGLFKGEGLSLGRLLELFEAGGDVADEATDMLSVMAATIPATQSETVSEAAQDFVLGLVPGSTTVSGVRYTGARCFGN